MDIIAQLDLLQKSKEFKDWQRGHKDHYLAHAFKLIDEANKHIWQIGYYDKHSDTITTFVIEQNSPIKIIPDLEVFKEEKDIIKKLEITKVKISPQEALEKAEAFQKATYPNEFPTKIILVLQSIILGQVYNISFITKSLSTINVKVAADGGSIVEHHKFSLSDLKAKDQ